MIQTDPATRPNLSSVITLLESLNPKKESLKKGSQMMLMFVR
jgi:hypothetical protein